jgi:hypothetical protein
VLLISLFLAGEGGVTVSMDAFQAFDPGSTPGPRSNIMH